MKRLLIIAAVSCLATAASAKPLYITVPRTFSSEEQAEISVSFAGKEPVELRVLQPNDLEKLIAEQASLRRAYAPPSTELNPGRYLSRGFNHVVSPGTFLFHAMSTEFRAALAPTLPERQSASRELQRLREGPEKLISLPPAMTLVRSEWLNLDLGGGDVDFNVPGFEQWGGASGYQERSVTLPRMKPGFYVLQLVQGTVEGQVSLVITDQSVQVKQTDGQVLVRIAGRDQRALADVKVRVYAGGKNVQSGSTDKHGEVTLDASEQKLLIVSGKGDDVAVVDTDFYSTLAVVPDVFIYSDRPIYRPGDEVSFRGVVRKPSSFLAELFLPKKRSVDVSLMLEGGGTAKAKAEIDAYGSFSGKLAVPPGTPQGVVRLLARVDNDKDAAEHQAEARVQEYVKPTFYLEIASEQEGVSPGEKIKAKVRARRYAGGAPKAKLEYFLYRTQLETPAWVDDAGRGGQGSAITYGSASTTEGQLSLPKRLFSSVAKRMENAEPEADPWASAESFDKNGEASIEVDVPPLEDGEEHLSFRYSLSVKAKDEQNTEAASAKSFFLSDCDVATQVSSSTKIVKKGGEASIAVRAASLSGKAYGEAEGTLALFLRDASGQETKLDEKAIKTGADGIARAQMPTSKIGTLIARATLKDKKGRANQNEASALVIGEGAEAVADVPVLVTEALGSVLEPGGTAELAALFPREWGPGARDKGQVWVTLSGSGLFATELVELSGRTLVYKFGIEKRFGSVVYASIAYPTASGRWDERLAAFRIVPRERVLSVRVEPVKAEVSPLGEQSVQLRVSDSEGRGVPSQVSIGVVDKAVYALQAELRPAIVDFFYPVGRNNVSSFYSMDFQGYGYGEQLARLKLGLRPYEFAAVKPPSKRARDLDRDTAYWNPSVFTGSDGTANVSFKMPSNQTLWVITAVAADTSGRFGEGRGEFASRGALSLSVAMPQFMRVGDEAKASVRVALGSEASNGQIAVALAGNESIGALNQELTLAKGEEQVLPFTVKAQSSGSVVAALSAKLGGDALSDVKRVAVKPAVIEERVRVSAWGGGELQLPTQSERLVSQAELSLVPGSVDAALASLDDLLTYPYGCLEQLVATTVPNIALSHLLAKQGLKRLDPSSQALLQLARSRAQNGIDRILALAQKGGGFVWFPGESTPSVPLTLIALDGLSYAVDAGVVAKEASEIAESAQWLAKQESLPFAFEATRAYVLARLEGAKQAPAVRALVDKVEPTNDLYALAITALAAQHAGVANEAGLKERLAAVVAKSRALLAQNASLTSDAFYSYPLRSSGLAAIVAHASSTMLSEAELKDARKRFIQTLASGDLSTFDRSTLTLHHLWLIEKDAAQMKALAPPSVDVKGQVTLSPFGFGLQGRLPAGATSVKVGAFDGVATLEARTQTPLASIQPLADGMSIKRSYYLLREQGRKRLADNEAVKVGDLVYTELEFDAEADEKWRSVRSAYYVVEDSVPAGFVVQSEDKIYRAAPFGLPLSHEALKQRAFTPESATFFFSEPAFWSRSAHTIGYVMRAQFSGRFQTPPAMISDMYAAKVRGRTKASVFTVD